MEIYLDNSATTRPYRGVTNLVADVMYNSYGNPSSLHRRGMEAEKLIKTARENIAQTLRVHPKEIYFTSGGTEADNLAIMGLATANRGGHILSTPIEHPAVMNTLKYMESLGYTVEFLPVDSRGLAEVEALERMLRSDTVLVTCMYVNNEIGTIQPVSEMAQIIKRKNLNTMFHIDAVQAYCKIPFTAASCGADAITLSSHKIHGPKGMGALYVKGKTKISPVSFGGGQQDNLRPGTENVAGIAGFGLAARHCHSKMRESLPQMEYLRDRLKSGILAHIPNVKINTPERIAAPHILNVSFGGVRSEVLLHSLELDEIYVSSGSACSSHKKGPSYVLTAIGLENTWIDGSIRFSLSEFTTRQEIDTVIEALTQIVPKLRRVSGYKG